MNNLTKKLNKDNVFSFIDAVFTPTFHETNNEVTKSPAWFLYLVNYWNDKDEILSIFEYVRITIPEWAYTFQLPFEWNEETLDLFLDTIQNHYVCNGAIYSNNLGYWLRQADGFDFIPSRYFGKNYTEIPWQFVLRNPLLNNLKYAQRIAKNLVNSSNMIYFLQLPQYQDLSPEWVRVFTSFLDLSKIHRDHVSRVLNFLVKASELVGFENLSNYSIEWLIKSISDYNLNTDLINRLPYDFKILALRRYNLNKFVSEYAKIDLPNNTKKRLLDQYLENS